MQVVPTYTHYVHMVHSLDESPLISFNWIISEIAYSNTFYQAFVAHAITHTYTHNRTHVQARRVLSFLDNYIFSYSSLYDVGAVLCIRWLITFNHVFL